MKAVTVSPKFQGVIPRDLRKSMDIQPSAKVQILQGGDSMLPSSLAMSLPKYLEQLPQQQFSTSSRAAKRAST